MTTTPEDDPTMWGMWADTGDVDPVLARMLHLLRCRWRANPEDAHELSGLDAIVASSRGDNELSRRRALFVVDRALRRDLPRLLRAAPRGGEGSSPCAGAADRLEQLAPLESSQSMGCAVTLTFDLERRVDEVDGRMIRGAWEVARHAELALLAGRIYQLGSAAVSVCEMFVLRRDDLTELGHHWAPARDLARSLAFAIIHEAAAIK
jgi:hypothetical protein